MKQENQKKWTRFMDMHSGGSSKEDFAYLYIEAPREEAESVFYARFGHSPYEIACPCCGENYSIGDHPSLEVATAYDRGCDWPLGAKEYDLSSAKMTLRDYLALDSVKVIYAKDIAGVERKLELPEIYEDDEEYD